MPGFMFLPLIAHDSQEFSHYTSSSKYARAENMAKLWISMGCTGFWICLNKPEYSLIVPQYALICLNNAECAWIYLIISE